MAWWREWVDGSPLILGPIALCILRSVGAQQMPGWSILRALQGWLILGFPFLIGSILFLISSWLSRKSDSSAAPPSLTSYLYSAALGLITRQNKIVECSL